VAKVVQNSILTPTAVFAGGSVDTFGDTVRTTGQSLLTTTFDLATATPYTLTTRYEYLDEIGSRNVDVALQQVEPAGNVDLIRRAKLLNNGPFHDGVYVEETSEEGVLGPGRYALQLAFTAYANNQDGQSFSYDVRLTVPEPSIPTLLLGATAPAVALRSPRHRRHRR
jgi:hypothetical protein